MAVLALHAQACGNESVDSDALAGIKEFTAAYHAWDAAGFGKAAERFHKATTSAPKSARNFYWLGVSRFHQMLQLRNQDPPKNEAADVAMQQASQAFQTVLGLDPDHSESHALMGTIYGMQIHGSILNAVRYGPRLHKHQKLALKNGAENPRVRYLLGTGYFHTSNDEAGYRQALATLLESEKLFLAERRVQAHPFAPRWGLSSCRTFIGLTLVKLGDKNRAVVYLQKALDEHPNDHIARKELNKLTAR